MATYTIEINERTKKGKAIRTLLEHEDVVRFKPAKADLLVKEIVAGLSDVKKMQEGKLPKRTVAQMLNDL